MMKLWRLEGIDLMSINFPGNRRVLEILHCFRSGQQENDSVRISPQVYKALSMLISFVCGWSQESDYSVFSGLTLESIGPGLYIKQNKRTLRHLRDENVGQSLQ